MASVAPSIVAGRYRLLGRIAEGGMGVVFRAEHTLSKKKLAVKLLHPHLCHGRQAVERFKREVSAAAEIDHPGIVQIFDAGVDTDGSFYMAMELLEGESLAQRSRRDWPGTRTAVAMIAEMCEPLAKAHAKGFVHRDLKPDNVFLARDAETGRERLKLLDFGLVREVSRRGPTMSGITFGTPEYMSPEQAMSAKKAGVPADVWSVGAMLYELLAGKHPFTGETPNAVMANAIKEPLCPLAQTAPHVPPDLAAIVERCLEKDPARRPANAGELGELLRDVMNTLVLDEQRPPSPEIGRACGDEDAADEAEADGVRSAVLRAAQDVPMLEPAGLEPSRGTAADALTEPRSVRGAARDVLAELAPAQHEPAHEPMLGPAPHEPMLAPAQRMPQHVPELAPAQHVPAQEPPVRRARSTPSQQPSLAQSAPSQSHPPTLPPAQDKRSHEHRVPTRLRRGAWAAIALAAIALLGTISAIVIGGRPEQAIELAPRPAPAASIEEPELPATAFPPPPGPAVEPILSPSSLPAAATAAPPSDSAASRGSRRARSGRATGPGPLAAPAEETAIETATSAARACLARGDMSCAVGALEHARGPGPMSLLVDVYRAQGRTSEARAVMRRYIEQYPRAPQSATYRRQLGVDSNSP